MGDNIKLKGKKKCAGIEQIYPGDYNKRIDDTPFRCMEAKKGKKRMRGLGLHEKLRPLPWL